MSSSEHTGPGPDLIFISQTGTKSSKETQSVIRRHVMRDKGRARRKAGRDVPPLKYPPEIANSRENFSRLSDNNRGPGLIPVMKQMGGNAHLLNCNSPLSPSPSPPYSQDGAISIEWLWTGRMDPFVRYPIRMTSRSLQLIDHGWPNFSHARWSGIGLVLTPCLALVFDDRYGNTPPYRDAWLPIGMVHAAAFHQVLSNAALNMASLRERDCTPETRESMIHHLEAVKLVAKGISDRGFATSDEILGAIIGFACYAHATGNQAGWHMHLNAVEKLISLRGGIDTLNSNRLLRMVLFWVDVGGACTEDIKPRFPPPTELLFRDLRPRQCIMGSPAAERLSQAWAWVFPEHLEIILIMSDLRTFVFFLQDEVLRTNGQAYSSGELAVSNILPIQHRLLSLISSSCDKIQQKVDIVRLGCTLFLAEIRRLFGIMGVISSLQTRKLRGLLQQQTDSWGPVTALRAWVLAMGAMESCMEERKWFFAELQKSKTEMGIETWDGIQLLFRDILWYDDVHNSMFGELCNGAQPLNVPKSHLLGGSRFGGYRPLR